MNTKLLKEQIPTLTLDELINHLRLSEVNSDEYIGLVPLMKHELGLREPTYNYACKNCGHDEFKESTLYSSYGSFWTVFESNPKRYRSIACKRCAFVEFYASDKSNTEVVLGILFN